ncbi:hypothetical protein EVAR_30109_1 [Eumeta japonica]|uniref:Uncharacterized protein n=1 Tax=Eumeta variegata TaxID=151549 RepID=A0A4C1WGW1_EUMVA|nr:hypothetical protein EVAR_30109_1 [Eumeta japonica]
MELRTKGRSGSGLKEKSSYKKIKNFVRSPHVRAAGENHTSTATLKLVTKASQWPKIGTLMRRRKAWRALNLRIASFAGNSERQSFVLCTVRPIRSRAGAVYTDGRESVYQAHVALMRKKCKVHGDAPLSNLTAQQNLARFRTAFGYEAPCKTTTGLQNSSAVMSISVTNFLVVACLL